MRQVWFYLIGLAILWMLPGVVSTIRCITSPRLRDRAVQLSRHALRCSIQDYAARRGMTAEEVWRRFYIQDARLVHMVTFAVTLVLVGPRSMRRVRELERAQTETRLE